MQKRVRTVEEIKLLSSYIDLVAKSIGLAAGLIGLAIVVFKIVT